MGNLIKEKNLRWVLVATLNLLKRNWIPTLVSQTMLKLEPEMAWALLQKEASQ